MQFLISKIGTPSIRQYCYPRYLGSRNPITRNILSIDANGLRKATTDSISGNQRASLKTTREGVNNVLNKLNELFYLQARTITFQYDERIEEVVAKVTEVNTGRIIRQIPSEELIRLTLKMNEFKKNLINTVI